MSKALRILVGVLLIGSFSLEASAKRKRKPDGRPQSRQEAYDPRSSNEGYRDKHNYPRQENNQPAATSNDDAAIVNAVNRQARVNYIAGANMEVVKLLPDDNSGLTHQKFIVRLSNGKQMEVVYNTDMCPRIPVNVGDRVGIGGQLVWTNRGALIHWLHHDPRGNRPAGYVELNGQFYCRE